MQYPPFEQITVLQMPIVFMCLISQNGPEKLTSHMQGRIEVVLERI